MAQDDYVAGKIKQVKGKVNDTMGALKGDTGHE